MRRLLLAMSLLLYAAYGVFAQNGLDFDGVNDVVQTTYTGVLGAQDRTFEAWIFVSPSAPASNLAILDYGTNLAGSRNTFLVSGTRELRFISGGTNANIGTAVNAVPVNQWVHVAFVLDNGTGYLYVNGSQMGTGSLSSVNTPGASQNVKLGERVLGGTIPFMGSLDEVRVWDVARTATQIQIGMNGEFCNVSPNLKLYLKLNEGVAGMNNALVDTAVDHSGNNYDGVLNNFSLSGATSNWVNGSGVSTGSTVDTVQQHACTQYLWPVNSMLYTATGLYTETLTGANAQGCDSIVTLDLTIDTINTTITQNGSTLMANANNARYQWVSCPDFTSLVGDTNQSFTATANGDYAVIVTDSLCSDTSTCISINNIGLAENHLQNQLVMIPNPTRGDLSVDLGKSYSEAAITIMDLSGKRLFHQTHSRTQQLELHFEGPDGVYLLVVEAEGQKATAKVLKQ